MEEKGERWNGRLYEAKEGVEAVPLIRYKNYEC
jgi:hypothetical protein